MKKQLSVLLALVLVFLMVLPLGSGLAAAANYNVKVIVNGKLVDFSGGFGQPFISDDNRTMVPVRAVAEKYGCEVGWDDAKREVSITFEDHYAIIPIGQPYIYTDSGTRQMDTRAVILNDDRTYIPIRFAMEAMGAEIGWVESKTLVLITNPNIVITDHDEDLVPENRPGGNNGSSYVEEAISDDGSLSVLKNSIKSKGSWDASMGYVYTMTSANSDIKCKLVYNTSEDRVYLMSVMSLNSSGSEYMAQQIHINGSNNGTTSFVFRILSNGADVQSAGHLIKGAYGNPPSYAVDSVTGTSKDMQGSMLLGQVIPYQTALAMDCLGSYCSSNGLRINAGSLGFAVI